MELQGRRVGGFVCEQRPMTGPLPYSSPLQDPGGILHPDPDCILSFPRFQK